MEDMSVSTQNPEPFSKDASNSEAKTNADLYRVALRPELMQLKSHPCCIGKQGYAFLQAFVTRLPVS